MAEDTTWSVGLKRKEYEFLVHLFQNKQLQGESSRFKHINFALTSMYLYFSDISFPLVVGNSAITYLIPLPINTDDKILQYLRLVLQRQIEDRDYDKLKDLEVEDEEKEAPQRFN